MIATKYDVSKKQIESVEDLLNETKMNWVAQESEMITSNGISIPKHKAIYRDDINKVIGVVGSNYTPVQNFSAFAFMDAIKEKFGAKYNSVMVVDNGARTIMQAEIDKPFNVNGGDKVAKYITAINSFDGSTPLRAFFTPMRLVCTNQLRAIIRSNGVAEHVSIRHTKSVEMKMEEAFMIFGMGIEYFKTFQEQANDLAQKNVTSKMVDKFLAEVMGEKDSTRLDNQKDEVKGLFETGKGNHGKTAWDLYNGLTEYVDHFRSNDSDKRLASSLVGSGATMKAKAFEVAMAL